MILFEGSTADKVWRDAVLALSGGPDSVPRLGRGGQTSELLQAVFVISDPRERWIVSREPAMNPAFALAEVVWIVNGRDDSDFLNFWNPKLPQFAGRGPTYYGAYGQRLRLRYEVDQLERAYCTLRGNPESRQVVLLIWDPRSDLPEMDGAPRSEDVPCNVCSLLKISEGKLYWTQIMRSNDVLLGFPHNVVQFTHLHELMAGWLGLKLGSYTHLSDSLHAYEQDLNSLVSAKRVEPKQNTDHWRFTYDDSQTIFHSLSERMDALRTAGSPEVASKAVIGHGLPEPAGNLLAIVAADAARRHDWLDLEAQMANRCSNPILGQLWSRWVERYHGHPSGGIPKNENEALQ